MNKEEVEEILIMINFGNEEALKMKIYMDGTLCRQGCGGVPVVGIGGMSFTGSALVFEKLMGLLPQEVLNSPVVYEDKQINVPLEYVIAFYGVSKNGQRGEHAEWTKSTGIRFLLDSNTTFSHPLIGLIDHFAVAACEFTNSWYFDVIINAIYEFKSSTLPEQTIITMPKTAEEKNKGFQNYLHLIENSPKKWDVFSFAEDKTYTTKDGTKLMPMFSKDEGKYSFRFLPFTEEKISEAPKKRWKLW